MGEPAGTQENPTWTPLDFWSQFEPKVAKKLQAIQNPLVRQILTAGKTKFDKFAQFAENRPTRKIILAGLRHGFDTLAKLPEKALNQIPVDQPNQLIEALNQEMGGKIFLGEGDVGTNSIRALW